MAPTSLINCLKLGVRALDGNQVGRFCPWMDRLTLDRYCTGSNHDENLEWKIYLIY
jgi:hypothetical protein